MVNISRLQKGFNNIILDSKILNGLYRSAKENPAKFAARMALTSALTKDAVGCYYYVTQSLSNERIPEDKRNFVAAIDLMNGVLNIGLQFTVGAWLDKKSDVFFDSLVGKKLNEIDTRKIANKLTEIIKTTHPKENMSLSQIEYFLSSKKILGPKGDISKFLKAGFGAAIMLIATQIITKRIFVPFLATPLAGWYKDKYMNKKKPDAPHGRVYYEWKNLGNEKKIDQSTFGQFVNRR